MHISEHDHAETFAHAWTGFIPSQQFQHVPNIIEDEMIPTFCSTNACGFLRHRQIGGERGSDPTQSIQKCENHGNQEMTRLRENYVKVNGFFWVINGTFIGYQRLRFFIRVAYW